MIPVNIPVKTLAVATTVILCCLFFSCKKTDTVNTDIEQPADFIKKVQASVNGFVTNENNAPVAGARVEYGELFSTTDQFGYFEIKNATVTENAGVVTVKMSGYFNGIKTFVAQAGKKNFCRIKLIPKTSSGSVDAAVGGDVTMANGLKVSLPSAGIVDAQTGASYSGTVKVSSFWINPTAGDIHQIMPGDLRGISTSGALKSLTSFGMAAVELTGNAGQLLQIADGKKATLTFPLPNQMTADAPATIPLWYFDETKGLWVEEGSAIKSGNSYIGDVKHFTFWNCDLPNAYIPLSFTIIDDSLTRIGNVYVDITTLSANSWGHTGGYTDETGNVTVAVAPNTQYKLQISANNCSGFFPFSKIFSVENKAVDLGNVIVTGNKLTITGRITGCNNSPLPGGHIIMRNQNVYEVIIPGTDGSFKYSSVKCDNTVGQVSFTAVDPAATLQGAPITRTINSGFNDIGNLQACGISMEQYFNFTLDDKTYVLAPIPSSLMNESAISGNRIVTSQGILYGTHITGILYDPLASNGAIPENGYIMLLFISHLQQAGSIGNSNYLYFLNFVTYLGNPVPADIALRPLVAQSINNVGSVPVTITEYGAVDEFVSGYFNTTLYPTEQTNGAGEVVVTDPHHVVINFRIRRKP